MANNNSVKILIGHPDSGVRAEGDGSAVRADFSFCHLITYSSFAANLSSPVRKT